MIGYIFILLALIQANPATTVPAAPPPVVQPAQPTPQPVQEVPAPVIRRPYVTMNIDDSMPTLAGVDAAARPSLLLTIRGEIVQQKLAQFFLDLVLSQDKKADAVLLKYRIEVFDAQGRRIFPRPAR